MKEDFIPKQIKNVKSLRDHYEIFLTEDYGPIYESITSNLPLSQRTSLRQVDKTISQLVTRKYEFILSCTEKYEEYINNKYLDEDKIGDFIDSTPNSNQGEFTILYPSIEELRVQLLESHFSWMVFMFCINTMKLREENLEELITIFLSDQHIELKVKKYSSTKEKDKDVTLTQNSSLKFLVCYIINT